MNTTLTRLDSIAVGIVSGYAHGGVATLGENLKQMRGTRDQGEIAEKMSVPQGRLSNWENDRYQTVTVKTLLWLAWGYGCSVEDLVIGLDDRYDALRRHVPAPPPQPAPVIASLEANEILSEMEEPERLFAIDVLKRLHGRPVEASTQRRRRAGGQTARRSR